MKTVGAIMKIHRQSKGVVNFPVRANLRKKVEKSCKKLLTTEKQYVILLELSATATVP